MTQPYPDRIVERLREAEREWSLGVRTEQGRWRHRLYRGRIRFDKEMRRRHRRFRQSVPSFLLKGRLRNLITTPVIYSLAVPFLLLDLWVTAYQLICFPIYGIARVRRRSYFVIDRHRLAYLNAIEKAHCVYCSYANGVVGYVRAVVALTEQYWCPIKHGRAAPEPHDHYPHFFDYGDAEGYRRDLPRMRKMLGRQPRKRLAPAPAPPHRWFV